ncbi:MAG: hypothetical protein GOMPHAMPRED_000738 [Gomphillus americanus]|uniref:Ribosome biogenesis regulatory protein n=1 Tax=Gomphillus americanus TaxID=1940652 RepID=A0A8H3F0P1_9LECA|nr:MAG: hypothetical protein GOMPHAMPRED_000738 [Gomphillus americanus]
MEGIEQQPAASVSTQQERPSVTVTKPIPYTFDLGNLTVFDENIVSSNPSNAEIASISRDCAQALINQLLTTCTIHTSSKNGTLIKLPAPSTPLPREKPLPAPKQETKWEKFARKKGITKSKETGSKVYDEELGEWVSKWGYKGKNKAGENQWLVEVDEKKERTLKDGETVRGLNRRERVDNVKRNERKQKANERRERKYGA